MKFSFAGIKSEFLQDQTSLVERNINTGSVGPHVPTTRWTYTVPANKRSVMMSAYVQSLRLTAAGPAVTADNSIEINTNSVMIMAVIPTSFGAGGFSQIALGVAVDLPAGTVVTNTTSDPSTGGTIRYISSAVFEEYDA